MSKRSKDATTAKAVVWHVVDAYDKLASQMPDSLRMLWYDQSHSLSHLLYSDIYSSVLQAINEIDEQDCAQPLGRPA